MGITDILIILFITIGPTKAAAMYVGMTESADSALMPGVPCWYCRSSALLS